MNKCDTVCIVTSLVCQNSFASCFTRLTDWESDSEVLFSIDHHLVQHLVMHNSSIDPVNQPDEGKNGTGIQLGRNGSLCCSCTNSLL